MSHDLLGKRIPIYARFSSEMQSEASLEDQVRRCSAFVMTNAGAVDERLVFKDAALSGSSLQRPALER